MAYETEVARGIALLDSKVPDWRDRINLDRLNLRSCEDCILGQLFGDFGDGLVQLELRRADDYGLDLAGGRWDELTEAWWCALEDGAS